MTGWRIGYTASNRRIATAMANFQSHATSNANSIAQAASIAALDGDKKRAAQHDSEFSPPPSVYDGAYIRHKRHKCRQSAGRILYLRQHQRSFRQKLRRTHHKQRNGFSSLLLEKANVAVVPGEAFGMPAAYALPMLRICKA